MKITPDHWIEDVKRDVITGGGPMKTRRCLVIHFTSGASAKSSIRSMRDKGLCAHLVIDRDGTIYQCRAFDRTAAHAGKSRWVDPNTGTRYGTANAYAIGIELANAGDDVALAKRWTKLPLVTLKHKNESKAKQWEQYPEAQMATLFELAMVLVDRYKLDDLVGHDDIAPERKNDPGPCLPMAALRKVCGFSGMPKVHWP